MTPTPFRKGDTLFHRFNLDLGPGRVEEAEGRRLVVFFPKSGERLTLAAADKALRPAPIVRGQRVRAAPEEPETIVRGVEGGIASLADGRAVPVAELWPAGAPSDPLERLAALEADRAA
ncbi:MAG TPA: hypothetical protein VLH41_08490, partial [Thermoanaerobaculia bacterium]|nr:hypothetical protein [Thermoanaerobaculia bacterium]